MRQVEEVIRIGILLLVLLLHEVPGEQQCPTNKKRGLDGTCVDLENEDVMRAMHMLANPPTTTCNNVTVVQVY